MFDVLMGGLMTTQWKSRATTIIVSGREINALKINRKYHDLTKKLLHLFLRYFSFGFDKGIKNRQITESSELCIKPNRIIVQIC